MPNKVFLETYPLYRKFERNVAVLMGNLPKVAINMECRNCSSVQTFTMSNDYWDAGGASNEPATGRHFRLRYTCAHCRAYFIWFLVATDLEGRWIQKVGQDPPWDITGDPDIERLLRDHASYFRKGLVCESQGYGIGAFGYYRRIVEEVIDALLDQVATLMAGNELETYREALEKTKTTTVTQEKIDLVKDLLPPILRPGNANPLSLLHSALSEGLHAESDEECMRYAEQIRGVLKFLVQQIRVTADTGKTFTDSMKKLLEKKARPS